MPTSTFSLVSDVEVGRFLAGPIGLTSDGTTLVWQYEDPTWYAKPCWLWTTGTPIPLYATINSATLFVPHASGSHDQTVRVAVEDSATPSQPTGDGSDLLTKDLLFSGDIGLASADDPAASTFDVASLIQALVSSVGAALEDILTVGWQSAGGDPTDNQYTASEDSGAPTLVVDWTDDGGGDPDPGGPDYELDAAPGSYVVTGSPAGVLHHRVIDADPGAYVVTGTEAGVLHHRVLDAEPAAYSVTGASAGALLLRHLAAAPGQYFVTGQPAGLARDTEELDAEPGVYLLTGSPAGLSAPRKINAATGSYLVTGVQAEIRPANETFHAAPGSYLVSGIAAGLAGPQRSAASQWYYRLLMAGA